MRISDCQEWKQSLVWRGQSGGLDRVVAAILEMDGFAVREGEWPGPAAEQMS